MGLFDKGPSAQDIIGAQTAANRTAARDTAKFAAVDQFSPFGSTTFQRRSGGAPKSQTIEFSPEVQRVFDAQLGTAGQLANTANLLSLQLPATQFDPSTVGSTSDVAQQIFDARLSLLQPEFDRRAELLDVNLANRGIPIGSEISNFERDRFQRESSDQLFRAATDAEAAARQEHQRLLNNEIGFRNQNIAEIAALFSGSPTTPTPQFVGTASPTVQPANVAQAHQLAQANQNNLKGGIGSAILGAGRLGLAAGGFPVF